MSRSTFPGFSLLALVLIGSQILPLSIARAAELPNAPQPQAMRPDLMPRVVCPPGGSSSMHARICCAETAPSSLFHSAWYRPASPLTPEQKLKMAWLQFRDPFNLLTIAAEAGITIASDPHTAYGPGLEGLGKYAGVSASQNAAANFFGVFLIPALTHQDPRYYRTPNLPVSARIEHVIDSVAIGRTDTGGPMFNYAGVLGTIATSVLGNAYIPGRDIGTGATFARIGVALATAPAGNLISEFLPDVARHININVVLVQRVINRVAVSPSSMPQP